MDSAVIVIERDRAATPGTRRPLSSAGTPARRPMTVRRPAVSLLLAVVLAACASAPASPKPAGSMPPIPGATPVSSPAATAAALAPASPDPAPSPASARSGLPIGWRHELTCGDDLTGCRLHLYDAAGREQPGWPRDLAGGCSPENLAVGSDGGASSACRIDDRRTVVSAYAATGSPRPGWPVDVAGHPVVLHVGPDATVYLGISTGAY